MTKPTGRILASLLGGLLAVQAVGPVMAQVGNAPLPPPPAGEGWRPVNPRPLTPSESGFGQPQPLPPAQQFQLQTALLLRSGDLIQAVHRSGEALLVAPGETRAVSLSLDTPLRDTYGNLIVPAGAILEGQFQPVSGGTQFVSRALVINGQSYPLYAQSQVIPHQKDPRHTSAEAIVQDALIGAAAGALLGGLFGNQVISTEKVLGGAAAGAVIGNVTAPEVAIVNPNTSLTLTVTQDFQPYLP
ncbi:MAG: hypothetical protein Q6K80_11965 [Thermostichus sp. DG_1_6_bins_120]